MSNIRNIRNIRNKVRDFLDECDRVKADDSARLHVSAPEAAEILTELDLSMSPIERLKVRLDVLERKVEQKAAPLCQRCGKPIDTGKLHTSTGTGYVHGPSSDCYIADEADRGYVRRTGEPQ